MNMRMNERQEQTADVLGKLTVLGTIVLPMNIITGMWGMNVLVPGQSTDNLYWFWSSKFKLRFQLVGQKLIRSCSHGWIFRVWNILLFHCEECIRNRLIA